MKRITSVLLAAMCLLLVSCGGDGATRDVLNAIGIETLAAGESVTISAGRVVLVPAGTTVRRPNTANVTVISGNDRNIEVPAGSIITVPAAPIGEAKTAITGT